MYILQKQPNGKFHAKKMVNKSQNLTHSSGYGGSGKLRLPHSYAAKVTEAI
jgi:hypothetical protein